MSFSFATSGQSLGANANMNMGTGNPLPMTWAFWIKIGTGALTDNLMDIFRLRNAAGDKYFAMHLAGFTPWGGSKGILQAVASSSGSVADSMGSDNLAALDSGSWNHVALVYNAFPALSASSWLIYFNGTDATDHEIQTNNDDYAIDIANILIGTYNAGTPFKIAEIGLWKSALSGSDISLLYASKYAPGLVSPSTLRHHWSLWTAHANEGRDDLIGDADMQTKVGSPLSDAEHPTDIIYALGATTKYDIPTSVSDGIVRKIFIFSDSTFSTVLVNGATVTSSGGHFKYNDPTAVVGTARRSLMTGFGANKTVAASGGACWATGISE